MKNLNNKKIITSIILFSLLLILSLSFVNAYYNNTSSISVLASLVGDFEMGDGDVNMMFYKQVGSGYAKTPSVPALGYTFDDTKTNCSITCSNSNENADCYYHYNDSNKTFTINSDDKVTCKFYFNEDASPDINIYVLKEAENGSFEYNLKTYSLSESIPSYGFEYTNYYSCTNNSTLTYNSNTRSFSVETSQKDTCYVYFDKDGRTADVIANIYISDGTSPYEKVQNIPQNKTYELSQSETSSCTDQNATITYENGYIIISAEETQTCNIYLDEV